MSQGQGTRNGIHGNNEATFEQSFSRLQEVVQRLSVGNLTLQEALAAFEEGMALASRCGKLLDEAELRVKQVSAKAVRSGAEAVERLESVVPEAAAEGPAATVFETFEQQIIIDTVVPPASPPAPRAGNAAPARTQWEGRPAPQAPAPGPSAGQQRPGFAVRPPSGGGTADQEDKYAESLDLDPLFDDED